MKMETLSTKLHVVKQNASHPRGEKKLCSALKRMKPKLQNLPLKHVEEYCENSSIHGFSYFSNKDIHVLERIWWMLSVAFSMVGCCMLITDSFRKWDDSPVIVTFSEKMIHTRNIPFPAVTICPEVKSSKAIFNFSDALFKINESGPPHFGLSQDEYNFKCYDSIVVLVNVIASSVVANFEEMITSDTIFKLIKNMAPQMTETLVNCDMASEPFPCEQFLQDVITEDGLCFTFNSLTYEHMFHNGSNKELLSMKMDRNLTPQWTAEDGYGSVGDVPFNFFAYPFRVFTGGSNVGFKTILGVRTYDVDYSCRGAVQGFKVMVHSPHELPDVSGKHFRIPVSEEVRMSIKPNIMVTSKSLKDYSPDRRQCYFNSERTLRYMQTYSQQNCYLECIANFSLKVCGCVRFSLPRDSDTPICGVRNVLCYSNVEKNLWEDAADKPAIDECNCLPACTSISYDAEISQGKYEFIEYLQAINESLEEFEGSQFSYLSIFFKENQFISSKRSELIGMTDFVAACGGLLGLFMGISLLSIVEFVYYFSLRLFCSFRSKNSKTARATVTDHETKNQFHHTSRQLGQSRNIYW